MYECINGCGCDLSINPENAAGNRYPTLILGLVV